MKKTFLFIVLLIGFILFPQDSTAQIADPCDFLEPDQYSIIEYCQRPDGHIRVVVTKPDIDIPNWDPSPIPGQPGRYKNDYLVALRDGSGTVVAQVSLNDYLYWVSGVRDGEEITPAKVAQVKAAYEAFMRNQNPGITIEMFDQLLPDDVVAALNEDGSYDIAVNILGYDPEDDRVIDVGGGPLGEQDFYNDEVTIPTPENPDPEPMPDDPPEEVAPVSPPIRVIGFLEGCKAGNLFGGNDFEGCISSIGNNAHVLALSIGVLVSIFMLPFIGINLASGNPQNIEKGKEMLMSWAQGLLLIILSGVIVRLVATQLFGVS